METGSGPSWAILVDLVGIRPMTQLGQIGNLLDLVVGLLIGIGGVALIYYAGDALLAHARSRRDRAPRGRHRA